MICDTCIHKNDCDDYDEAVALDKPIEGCGDYGEDNE